MTVLFNNCRGRNHGALFGRRAFFDMDIKEAHRRQLPAVVPGTECIVAKPDGTGDIRFDVYAFSQEVVQRDGHQTVRVLYGDFVRTETLPRGTARVTSPYERLFAQNGNFKRLSALRVR